MKRITTHVIYDIEYGALLSWSGYWVDEQVVCFQQLKKGRETVEQNAAADQQAAKQNRAQSQEAYNKTQGLVNENIGSSTPGSLTPAATAQLAADRANIGRTYNGMRQAAFATLGQRGMGNAPSGFGVAANNGLNVGQEGAETGAYRNAQLNTERQRNFATSTEAGLTGQQGSLGNQASGESTQAGVARSQMGSTLGDIGQGLSTAAGIAGSVMGMVPGGGGNFFAGAGAHPNIPGSNMVNPQSIPAPNLGNPAWFNKIGSTSNIGSYGGG